MLIWLYSNQKTCSKNDGSRNTSVFYPNKTLNQQNLYIENTHSECSIEILLIEICTDKYGYF